MSIMKVFIVLSALVAMAAAKPIDTTDQKTVILRYDNDNIGVGPYNYEVETSDGQYRKEHAELRNVGNDRQALVVRGSYSYTGPDGKEYTINYVADEFGFQPDGAHLPKVLY